MITWQETLDLKWGAILLKWITVRITVLRFSVVPVPCRCSDAGREFCVGLKRGTVKVYAVYSPFDVNIAFEESTQLIAALDGHL